MLVAHFVVRKSKRLEVQNRLYNPLPCVLDITYIKTRCINFLVRLVKEHPATNKFRIVKSFEIKHLTCAFRDYISEFTNEIHFIFQYKNKN